MATIADIEPGQQRPSCLDANVISGQPNREVQAPLTKGVVNGN